jgi:hypothetical protein
MVYVLPVRLCFNCKCRMVVRVSHCIITAIQKDMQGLNLKLFELKLHYYSMELNYNCLALLDHLKTLLALLINNCNYFCYSYISEL